MENTYKERVAGAKIAREAKHAETVEYIRNMEIKTEGNTMYNLKNIMRNAWTIYHNANKGDGLKPIFSMCLSMAWDEAKNNTAATVSRWENMKNAEQVEYLRRAVKRAAKDEIAYSTEDKYLQYMDTVAWFLNMHNLDEFVSEAWIKLQTALDPEKLEARNARRVAAGKNRVKLSSLIYESCIHAINRIWRQDVKHGKAQVKTITDKAGNSYSYIDTMASSRIDGTEAKALGRVVVAEFLESRDNTDRIIIEMIRDGYKGKEIAAAVGISAPAVTKRLNKIREALKAEGIDPAWLAA